MEEIKNAKPEKYAASAEVKKFIEDNYSDLEKIATLLEGEPKNLRADGLKQAAVILGSTLGTVAGGAAAGAGQDTGHDTVEAVGAVVGFASMALAIISTPIIALIDERRRYNNTAAMDDLIKIRDSLAKLDKKQMPDQIRNKVQHIITKIDDAEITLRTRTRTIQ